jgi:hypothetical protein
MRTSLSSVRNIACLAVLLVSTFVLDLNSFGQSPVDSSRIVRVLTYNIYHGETMKGDFVQIHLL